MISRQDAVWLTIFSSFSLVLIIDWISNQRKLFMQYFERSLWVLLLSLCAELLIYFPINLDGLHFCVFSELSKQFSSSCKYLIDVKLPVIELGLSPPDIFWMPFHVSSLAEILPSESPRSIRQRQPGMHTSSHTRSTSIIFILPAKISESSHLKLTERQIKQKAVVGFCFEWIAI